MSTPTSVLVTDSDKMRGCGGKEHGCFGGVHGCFGEVHGCFGGVRGCFGSEQRLAGHDGAAVNETVTVTGAAEENETGATKSEYALEHAQHPSLSVH